MGIAAYNRGSAKISRDFERERDRWKESERAIVEQINSRPAGDVVVFTDMAISRFDEHRKDHVLMDSPEKGWASFGYSFPSLGAIREEFALKLVWRDEDEHGPFWLWAKEG